MLGRGDAAQEQHREEACSPAADDIRLQPVTHASYRLGWQPQLLPRPKEYSRLGLADHHWAYACGHLQGSQNRAVAGDFPFWGSTPEGGYLKLRVEEPRFVGLDQGVMLPGEPSGLLEESEQAKPAQEIV